MFSLRLLNHEHQSAATPYRSSYAIFVNESATETKRLIDEILIAARGVAPPRPSLRGFDEADMLAGWPNSPLPTSKQ